MDIDLAALPDDVETLQNLVRSLAAERTSLSEATAEIERLNLIIKKLQRSQFGRLRSESMTISCSSASKTSTPTLRAPKRAFRFPQ